MGIITRFINPESVATPAQVLKWSFSQHFLAESRGEEVIEHLLTYCHKPVQRKMLHAQLADEKKHVRLFKKVTEKIGLDEAATAFADGYVDLVMRQASLSEKIFCFQILTEAVSAAFCSWRLQHFKESDFSLTDLEVLRDEERHLSMGQCLLHICDQDELSAKLIARDSKERAGLIRDMNLICRDAFTSGNDDDINDGFNIRKSLFWTVSKTIFREAGQVQAMH